MATAVEAAIAEIDERLATFGPQYAGLKGFARLPMREDTLQDVNASIFQYEKRIQALNNAKVACAALMADGHPDLTIREISASEFADLKANADMIEAALARFDSNAPTSFAFTAGAIEPK